MCLILVFILVNHKPFLKHFTLNIQIPRWLDPQKLVRKQVRRSSSHSSSNATTATSTALSQPNGHGQKTSGSSNTTNVIILHFRVKFYVTGMINKILKYYVTNKFPEIIFKCVKQI